MSNILIIKLGSLGDVVQISGALRDIREHHKNEKITILTTSKYLNLFLRTKGESQLTDALQLMVDRGEKFTTFSVDGWYD